MTTRVVFLSGGVGSWAAAMRVRDGMEPGDRLVLLFTDTKTEDASTYAFLEAGAAKALEGVDGEFVKLADGRDIWEVFRDVRMIGNTRIDPCSRVLKRELAASYIRDNFDPDETVLYVGIDWTEVNRLPAIVRNWQPFTVRAPLMAKPYLTKAALIAWAESEGLPIPELYARGFPHANCFTGDTEIITESGVKRLDALEGEAVRVLGKWGAWKDATVRSFGRQPVGELVVERFGKTMGIRVTEDHLWFVREAREREKIVTTSELRPGDKIPYQVPTRPAKIQPSPFGVARGFVYGDGSAPNIPGRTALVRLCGEKDRALLPFFSGCRMSEDAKTGDPVVYDIPQYWKREIPPMGESRSYLYGWLAGYFAADGSVSSGEAVLSSADLDSLRLVSDLCIHVGVEVGPIRTQMRMGFGDEASALYGLPLPLRSLSADFFIHAHHREQMEAHDTTRPRLLNWRVVEYKRLNEVEEVYCAVVPDGEMFALAGSVRTHNCGGACVKAGHAQWARLLREYPERYAHHEEREQSMRDYLGRDDVAILRDRRDGGTQPLTLASFRERIETASAGQGSLWDVYDPDDWGGCGCFTDYDEAAR